MTRLSAPSLTPQAVLVYRLLLKGDMLAVREIGEKLKIFPNAVYRELELLRKLALIERIGGRPVRFRTKSVTESLSNYLLAHKQWFGETFSGEWEEKKNLKNEAVLKTAFVQNRQELMEWSTKDLSQAKKEVCLLVSGHEAPAETMLQHKRALERGVSIKMLTQHLSEENREMFRNWQLMGIKVRYGKTPSARVFIFDSTIVYITSYSLTNKNEATGVRFNYPPIAELMREQVFDRYWRGAKTISSRNR